MIEQGLGTAQTGGVIDYGFGTAQAGLVAHPRLWQGPGALALFAPTPAASRADDRIEERWIAAHYNRIAGHSAGLLLEQLLQSVHMLLAGWSWLFGNDRRLLLLQLLRGG